MFGSKSSLSVDECQVLCWIVWILHSLVATVGRQSLKKTLFKKCIVASPSFYSQRPLRDSLRVSVANEILPWNFSETACWVVQCVAIPVHKQQQLRYSLAGE